MTRFLEALRAPEPLILDGGLGSMLLAAGLPAGTPPESWVLERPEAVAAIHRAYAEAGSDAVHTCTFGLHPLRLAAFGLEDRCEEIATAAVGLARASGARFVIGDLGPTGEFLPPVGKGDLERWRSGFEHAARALAAAGVDALHVETIGDLREAACALGAMAAAAPGTPRLVSMTFERRKRGFHTVMGDPPISSLRDLESAGADAVGVNCTLGSRAMLELAREARASVHGALIIQPNAGQPRLRQGVVVYEQSAEDFAADLCRIAAVGVDAVGGCCGTDPAFIACLAARLGAAAR